MGTILLPKNADTGQPLALPSAHSYTIIGGNGAGKSRFMELLITMTEGNKSVLSPIGDSIPYTPARSLTWLLEKLSEESNSDLFAKVREFWSLLFSGNQMVKDSNGIWFTNNVGPEPFDASRLSRGEKSALWFLVSVALADPETVLFIDSPTIFLHPSVSARLWNELEQWKTRSVFVYDTNDPVFAASRQHNIPIWIKSYTHNPEAWSYTIVNEENLSDDFLLDILGSRRPVLFIEGDATHSIDARLYSAIFKEYDVRPVGSCNKVIEATRTFSSLNSMHRLESHGLVDRDRRTCSEVAYLRMKNIMVPEVAEVENIFLAEGVVRIMARLKNKNPDKVFRNLKAEILGEFRDNIEKQALQHTRHIMKRDVERKIDARFTCITALELHIKGLINKLKPREHYNTLLREFRTMLSTSDYAGILRVFNEKRVFRQSSLHGMLNYSGPDQYIEGVLRVLHSGRPEGEEMRQEILKLFETPQEEAPLLYQEECPKPKPTATQVVKHNRGKGIFREEKTGIHRQNKNSSRKKSRRK